MVVESNTPTIEEDEELIRGANLRLAQRHHKITAGSLTGSLSWTTVNPCTPGRTGPVSLKFTTSGHLPINSILTLKFPPTSVSSWRIPSSPNTTLRFQSRGILPPTVTSVFENNVLTFTILDEPVAPNSSVILNIAGVTTPAVVTPSTTLTLTTFEPLVHRNTTPASTRGGQVVDGPTSITTVATTPGTIGGKCTWTARNTSPGNPGPVTVSFKTFGEIPVDGCIRIEVPPDGWSMDESSPEISCKAGNNSNCRTKSVWEAAQHVLLVTITDDAAIPMNTKVDITISNVTNPTLELESSTGHITTLGPNGRDVIDGPSKLTIDRVSALTLQEIERAGKVYDAFNEGNVTQDVVPNLLQQLSIHLDSSSYQSLVVDVLPEMIQERTEVVVENPEEANSTEDGVGTESPSTSISKEVFTALFTTIYRPATKYGSSLRIACRRNEKEKVVDLVQRGCSANNADGAGWTSLHHAASYGREDIIKYLVEFYATQEHDKNHLELDGKDTSGWTPLMCAAANGHRHTVELLMKLGADPTVRNNVGRTALHWVCAKGMDSIITPLALASEVDKNSQDDVLSTPCHLAAIHGNNHALKILLELGADPSIRDKLGYDVLHYVDAAGAAIVKKCLRKKH